MLEAVPGACRGEIDCGIVRVTIDNKSPGLLPCVKADFGAQASRAEIWHKRRDIGAVHIFNFFRRHHPRYCVRIDTSTVELLCYFHTGARAAEIGESVDNRLSTVPAGHIPNKNRRTGTKALGVRAYLEPMQDLARHLQMGRDGAADQARKPCTRRYEHLVRFVVCRSRPLSRGPGRIGGYFGTYLDPSIGEGLETDRSGVRLKLGAVNFCERQQRANALFREHIS